MQWNVMEFCHIERRWGDEVTAINVQHLSRWNYSVHLFSELWWHFWFFFGNVLKFWLLIELLLWRGKIVHIVSFPVCFLHSRKQNFTLANEVVLSGHWPSLKSSGILFCRSFPHPELMVWSLVFTSCFNHLGSCKFLWWKGHTNKFDYLFNFWWCSGKSWCYSGPV